MPPGSYPAAAAQQQLVAPGRALLASRFIPEALRTDMQQRSYMVHAQMDPDDPDPRVPQMVQQFHSLYPLEDLAAAEEHPSQVFGLRTALFKATNSVDGLPYAVRRVDSNQLALTGEFVSRAHHVVELWAPLAGHPGIAALHAVFVTKDGSSSNAPCMYFVHDYIPGAVTLEQAHMRPTATPSGLVRQSPTEEQLWGYLVQMASVLRAVHSAGLVLRPACLTPSKVLLATAGRIRVGCVGVSDVLSMEVAPSKEELAALQQEDLTATGALMLALACSGVSAMPAMDALAAHFSMDFTQVVSALLASAEGQGMSSWQQLAGALGGRVLGELDTVNTYSDMLLSELTKEVENGRLLRLLVKLAAVNERPEGDVASDPHWSETGDRYLLKLFRDYVFHQVDEHGAPMLDWGLMAECLNKLDSGVPEKVLLMSRDEQSLLVASYADLHRCLDTAYTELMDRGAAAKAGPGGGPGRGGMPR